MTVFDFHFHLLFKHAVSDGLDPNADAKVGGFTEFLDTIFGGPFESQSSPRMVLKSPLQFGVIGILAIEHAFVADMMRFLNYRLDKNLPISYKLVEQIRDGKTTYYEQFNNQVNYTIDTIANQHDKWKFRLLNRGDEALKKAALEDMDNFLNNGKQPASRWFTLSIEGGHNLCEIAINHPKEFYHTPEVTLRNIMSRQNVDFIAMNLCHLSFIRELNLGGFAQGLNKKAKKAFRSEAFLPNEATIGITPLGRKVIREALCNKQKPIIIDVKHMSLYARLQYYKFKEKLEDEFQHIRLLPIISSHTGFTFTTHDDYIRNKRYKPVLETVDGRRITTIQPMERKIGRSDDLIGKGLHCNPWTISLFDEEILEIIRSEGLIGISLDQRVLGTENMFLDSERGRHYEKEHLSREEYIKLFEKRELPGAEGIFDFLDFIAGRKERHSMLLALHVVHTVKIAKHAGVLGNDETEPSPWDYVCIGSDFDGLINPINTVQNVMQMPALKTELMKYLPQADKSSPFYKDQKALNYDSSGNIDRAHMERMIDKVLARNGVRFLKRFMENWGIK